MCSLPRQEGVRSPKSLRFLTPYCAAQGKKVRIPDDVRLLTLCCAQGAVLLALLCGTAAAAAQSVEVSASLDLTDGYARKGTYLPVRLRIANRTQDQITDVRLSSSGPVDVEAPLELAPGARGEAILPFLFFGGTPTLSLEFLSNGKSVERATVGPLSARTLGDEEALVAVEKGLALPEGQSREALAGVLGVKTVQVVSLTATEMGTVRRFGAADALVGSGTASPVGRAIPASPEPGGQWGLGQPRFPSGVEAPLQPAVYRMLAPEVWPTAERTKLWLWLGLVCLAVVAAGLWVPRRRALLATVVLVVLAGVATVLVGYLGELSRTRTTEARVFCGEGGGPSLALERLVLLESRGGASARFEWDPSADPLPVPVLASSSDVFTIMGTLNLQHHRTRLGVFEARRSQVILQILTHQPLGVPDGSVPPTCREIPALAATDRAVQALRVEGDSGTSPLGEAQPLEAWSAQWRESPRPELAYAGRSLAWWKAERREGEEPVHLLWYRERPGGASAGAGAEAPRWLPSLVVCRGVAAVGTHPPAARPD